MENKTNLHDPMGVELQPADRTTNLIVRSCFYALLFIAVLFAALIVSFYLSYNMPWK